MPPTSVSSPAFWAVALIGIGIIPSLYCATPWRPTCLEKSLNLTYGQKLGDYLLVIYLMQIEQDMKTTHTGDVWSFMTQAMPLDYNNPKAPFYSEVEREFAPVQDWTVNDAKTLVLYVQGRSSNGPSPRYVAVEDSSKHLGTIAHPDPAAVTLAQWTEWRIPFSEFTASGVKGSGSRTWPASRRCTSDGATGRTRKRAAKA